MLGSARGYIVSVTSDGSPSRELEVRASHHQTGNFCNVKPVYIPVRQLIGDSSPEVHQRACE
jgi:hypothetical protein